MEKRCLVSACLAGKNCRYDGKSQKVDYVCDLVNRGIAICVCPEQMGGLDTPRVPSERVGDLVMSKEGVDVTEEFEFGAYEALNIAQEFEIDYAILKSDSPSCGKGRIYDGTFTGTFCEGNGFTTDVLLENDIVVMDEFEGKIWYNKYHKRG